MVNLSFNVTYSDDVSPEIKESISETVELIRRALVESCNECRESVHVKEIRDGEVIEDRVIEPSSAKLEGEPAPAWEKD